MKILTIHTSYNELPLLRYKVEHCRQNKIDLYIIDNMSTDGTEAFLKEKGIPRSFVDTNNTFDLRPLLYAMERKIHELKPDWFIYSGVDMFPEALPGLRAMIEAADQEGFTQIRMNQMMIKHTGELHKGNPFSNYFYFRRGRPHVFISKYHKSITITPDTITRENIKVKDTHGMFFEMHANKPPQERMETLRRRQAAWAAGMNSGWGTHYPAEAKINFTWDKNQLGDIRKEPEFSLYTRLQNLSIEKSVPA